MSPKNKKKLLILRRKLDYIDNKLLNLLKIKIKSMLKMFFL